MAWEEEAVGHIGQKQLVVEEEDRLQVAERMR